jgi:serine/threonine protein kinase
MAPDQLEGKEVDTRTDIFAFGVVVYEMTTGKNAFEGKSQASLMAKILETDPPPMSSLCVTHGSVFLLTFCPFVCYKPTQKSSLRAW